MSKPFSGWRLVVGMLVVSVLLGSSYPVTRLTVGDFPPIFMAASRALVGTLFALAAFFSGGSGGSGRSLRLQPRDLWAVLSFSLFQAILFMAGMTIALNHISGAMTSLLVYTYPFLLALMAHFTIPDEKLTAVKLIGILLGLFGLGVAVWEGAALKIDLVGILAALGAALSWAVGSVLFKRSLQHLPAAQLLVWQNVVAVVGLVIAWWLFEGAHLPLATLKGTVAALWVGVMCSGVALLLWFTIIKYNPVSVASAYLFLSPVFGVLLSALLLGERLTPHLLSAVLFIVSGLYLVNRGGGMFPDEPARNYAD